MEVLNMLNAKYFIINDNEAQVNPDALGNAWWVEKVDFVATPNEEMAYLTTFNADSTAVADVKFKEMLGDSFAPIAQGDTIYETTYAPNELNYHAVTQNGGVAVFSEVYFPWGWNVTIDDQPAQLARVNYVLRALKVPAGNHKIEMHFNPQSIHTTTTLASVAIIIIYLVLIVATVFAVIGKTKEDETPTSIKKASK